MGYVCRLIKAFSVLDSCNILGRYCTNYVPLCNAIGANKALVNQSIPDLFSKDQAYDGIFLFCDPSTFLFVL